MPVKSLGAANSLVAVAMLLTGCGPAARSFRLSHEGNTTILVPPEVSFPAAGALNIKLRDVRREQFPKTDCDVHLEPISVEWAGRSAYIRVKAGSDLFGDGQAINGQPVSIDPLQFINRFREDLISLEANGCLHSGEAQPLLAKMAEKLPLPPFLAYLLRFGAFDLNQYVDLTPDFRLRVVYPVYSANNPVGSKEIKGIKTLYYKIVSERGDGRVRILEAQDESSARERTEEQKFVGETAPSFPDWSGYFRLFLKKNETSKDPITVAIVLGSREKEHLDGATKELDAATEPSCRAVILADTTCLMFPPLAGVNAEIRVKANGKEAFVRLGAQVNDLLDEPGANSAARFVEVRRLYGKHLAPIKADPEDKEIRTLILMPGDVVNFH